MKKLHKKLLIYKDTKEYYYIDIPVYEKYETITVPDYCDECDSEIGNHEEEKGINLLGYEKKKFKKDYIYHINKMTENMLSPIIVDRILNQSPSYSKITKKKFNIPK